MTGSSQVLDSRITRDELLRGCEAFEKWERRDAMYRVASRLIEQSWPDLSEVADALGVLLLTWNQAFYRYGPLDCNELERFLRTHETVLPEIRSRMLATLAHEDEDFLQTLFNDMLEASRLTNKKGEIRRSPVSIAKALHLLAPRFFPLWDDEIARAYRCKWSSSRLAFPCYLRFMELCQLQLAGLGSLKDQEAMERELSIAARFSKPLLKFLDEYNYAHFTKGWV